MTAPDRHGSAGIESTLHPLPRLAGSDLRTGPAGRPFSERTAAWPASSAVDHLLPARRRPQGQKGTPGPARRSAGRLLYAQLKDPPYLETGQAVQGQDGRQQMLNEMVKRPSWNGPASWTLLPSTASAPDRTPGRIRASLKNKGAPRNTQRKCAAGPEIVEAASSRSSRRGRLTRAGFPRRPAPGPGGQEGRSTQTANTT